MFEGPDLNTEGVRLKEILRTVAEPVEKRSSQGACGAHQNSWILQPGIRLPWVEGKI